MSHSDNELCRHILDEIRYLQAAMHNISFDEYIDDETLRRAVERSLEIIGEAVKNISPHMKQLHPEIEWKSIAGMRDKLIHHYFGVDYSLVWDVIQNKLPTVGQQIEQLFNNDIGNSDS